MTILLFSANLLLVILIFYNVKTLKQVKWIKLELIYVFCSWKQLLLTFIINNCKDIIIEIKIKL